MKYYANTKFNDDDAYLMHWGIKKGEQSKNHKYVARVGEYPKYKYFYTNEEYQAYLRGGKSSTNKTSVSSKLASLKNKVTSDVKSAVSNAKTTANTAASTAKTAASTAKSTVSSTTSKYKKLATTKLSSIKSDGTSVKDKITTKVNEAKEKAATAAKTVSKNVEDTAKEVQKKASTTVKKVADKTGYTAKKEMDEANNEYNKNPNQVTAKKALEKSGDYLNSTAGKTDLALKRYSKKLKEKIDEVQDSIEDKIDSKTTKNTVVETKNGSYKLSSKARDENKGGTGHKVEKKETVDDYKRINNAKKVTKEAEEYRTKLMNEWKSMSKEEQKKNQESYWKKLDNASAELIKVQGNELLAKQNYSSDTVKELEYIINDLEEVGTDDAKQYAESFNEIKGMINEDLKKRK